MKAPVARALAALNMAEDALCNWTDNEGPDGHLLSNAVDGIYAAQGYLRSYLQRHPEAPTEYPPQLAERIVAAVLSAPTRYNLLEGNVIDETKAAASVRAILRGEP